MGNSLILAASIDTIVAIAGLIVTIVIAIIGGVYKIVTDTKKYELTENFRKELLEWYTSVVSVLIEAIHYIQSGRFYEPDFSEKKDEILSRISSLAEVGRFYFPNVERDYGLNKPSAYRGARHINIEFLIHFYRNIQSKDQVDVDFLWRMERNFTSVIFDMVEPRKRNREYSKYLAISFPRGRSMKDFIYESPEIRKDLFNHKE